MHYGCDENKKKFRETENNKMKEKNKKNCRMHPGKYDFGHTGYKKKSVNSPVVNKFGNLTGLVV
jgi:hypothetical protein